MPAAWARHGAAASAGPGGGPWRSTFPASAASQHSVLGFPGAYSHDLRWAFTLKITAYLFVIILMFVRFARRDRREARSFDLLTDEELDALNREHLKGPHSRQALHER